LEGENDRLRRRLEQFENPGEDTEEGAAEAE
jgi:hypothetical protein